MNQEPIRIGQIEIRFLLEGADTGGALAMFEFSVPAGARVPIAHSHVHYDETIYGISGAITFTVDGKRVRIGPGESCFIPRGAVHGFNNFEQTNAQSLAVVTPARIGPEFFIETAAIVEAGPPVDVEKIKAVMQKHGLAPAAMRE